MRHRGGKRKHLEVVFFNGERGYCSQRGESNGRSGRYVIPTFSGASAIAFRRTPWSVMVGLTSLCRFACCFPLAGINLAIICADKPDVF